MKATLFKALRLFNSLKRPSKAQNLKLIADSGERVEDFTIRLAVADDLPELVALHVKTWADTYPNVKQPPTFAIREYQWKELFENDNGSWFCFVIAKNSDQLIGFALGKINAQVGNLSKIYLLNKYQRLGLGSLLLLNTVTKFIELDITSITVFAEGSNPSCAFYETLGAVTMTHPNGKRNYGAYYWDDLHRLRDTIESKINSDE